METKRPLDPKDTYYLTKGLDQAYTNTLDTLTTCLLIPFGVRTKVINTFQPFSDRISEYHNSETTKGFFQMFVRLLDQPIFKFQTTFVRHLQKRTDIEFQIHSIFNRLELNQIKTQSDLETTVSEMKNKIEAKIEEEQMEGSGWVLDKITSMEVEMSKTNRLFDGTYTRLTINNKAIISRKNC